MEGPQKATNHPLEKIKDWLKISALVGVSFVTGKVATEIYNDYEKNQEYQNHMEHTLTQQEKDKLSEDFERIKQYFGVQAIEKIKNGDKAAFFERQEQPTQKVVYRNFGKAGLSEASVKRMVSEESFFPKNFIDGEIRGLYFSEVVEKNEKGTTEGTFFVKEKAIVVFLKENLASLEEVNKKSLLWYIKHISAHELGHANDWETDKESSIADRANLLRMIGERLNSKDKLVTYQAKEGAEEYYDSEKDTYMKAKEYWADLCREYFSTPALLKSEFPADFKIIDDFVKKQDPDFDVFKWGGPYFDSHTGEMLGKWQQFTEEAMEMK